MTRPITASSTGKFLWPALLALAIVPVAALAAEYDFSTAPVEADFTCPDIGDDGTANCNRWEDGAAELVTSMNWNWSSDSYSLYSYSDGAAIDPHEFVRVTPAGSISFYISYNEEHELLVARLSETGEILEGSTLIEPSATPQLVVLDGGGSPLGGFFLYINGEASYFFEVDNVVVSSDDGPVMSQSFEEVGTGPNLTLIDLPHFRSVAKNVIGDGFLDVDFCIAPDPREDELGGVPVYRPQVLKVRDLAGKGTCVGEEIESLLGQTRLTVPPWFRTFKGTPRFGGAGVEGVADYWLVVSMIRTGATFDGPLVVSPIPESLIDYSAFNAMDPPKPEHEDVDRLKCDVHLNQRPMSLGGSVQAFGDALNVEGELMIPETIQCDGPKSMSRGTTHLYAMRLDGFFLDEAVNITQQYAGLALTLGTVGNCVNTAAVKKMASRLAEAKLATLLRAWPTAINKMEAFAREADGAQYSTSASCQHKNLKGGLIARSITTAFTLHDRFKHREVGSWTPYFPPEDLELPDLYEEYTID